jgi:hypothetical protein
MTKAQYRVYNRLAKKQVNRRNDVQVIDQSESSVTFHTAFPSLYLTYDSCGNLILTETDGQRKSGLKTLSVPGRSEVRLVGELGSPDYHYQKPVEIDDDDEPF